ncbi:MAG: TRAM domain-containing protein, partial [Hyphomonadaceae bacterium]|nr:TRAM domain-containing protein [Clostridia bacterium]
DDVLHAMNRKYTQAQYLKTIAKLKEKIQGIAITSDIIVGFPGETDEQFEDTIAVVRAVEFDMLFTYLYSKRIGTPSEKMPDVLTDAQKQLNFEKLLLVQNDISLKKNRALLGEIVEILVEGTSKTDAHVLTGRTRGGKIVHCKGDMALVGQFVHVKINEAQTWTLTGDIITL